MRYFTDNPLERMMMQKPTAGREGQPPAVVPEHLHNDYGRNKNNFPDVCYRELIFVPVDKKAKR
jgi:hypothetical protein